MSQYLRVGKKEMEIQHFSHHHPLVFIQDHSVAALCLGCEKPVEGWSYGCNQCDFYLHKGCAELELAPRFSIRSTPNTLSLFCQNHLILQCAICVIRDLRDLFIIVMIVRSICTSIVLCFNHPLLQIFLILCTPIHCSSFKIITMKSSLIVPDVRNQYLVQCTTVQIQIAHILDFLTFIRNVLNYPLRLITPTIVSILLLSCHNHLLIPRNVVSILLLSCHNHLLIPRNVVALCAESDGRGLFILDLFATLTFHLMIFFHHQQSQMQVMNAYI
ncbi:hypothetical protein V6Z11_A02G032400 [Gossypium hirsutum]